MIHGATKQEKSHGAFITEFKDGEEIRVTGDTPAAGDVGKIIHRLEGSFGSDTRDWYWVRLSDGGVHLLERGTLEKSMTS